ncbi:protein POLYCHOME [Abrus precatorius]|uniref:Protein POLYCHOME n=1 Tax=Abrus precatorius TaxID=3816 RepID=A0A8B8L6R6_ABRPR|nr:protein POLYCHOME [Abrus precatorius]
MPEARDRASPLHVATIFARRRASFIYLDPPPTPAPRNPIARPRARYSHAPGRENTPLVTPRRGRGRGSVLPSWYPRTPLRDITVLSRAIERRRARLGENEGQQIGDSDQVLPDPFSASQIERDSSALSPNSVGVKLRTPAGSKVPKIILDIDNLPEGESEILTPQKKLLNSIDKVEKGFREELQKLKRTPSAKKAEREKRVKTLMSMR